MKRPRIVILIVSAVILLVLGVSVYETTPVSMSDVLPDDNWTKAQIFIYKSNETQAIDIEGAKLEQLLTALNGAVVNNGAKFRGMSPPFFHIHLQENNGPGTLIYVLEDGRISIAVDCDTDHYRYFQGGEALYQAILQLAVQPSL